MKSSIKRILKSMFKDVKSVASKAKSTYVSSAKAVPKNAEDAIRGLLEHKDINKLLKGKPEWMPGGSVLRSLKGASTDKAKRSAKELAKNLGITVGIPGGVAGMAALSLRGSKDKEKKANLIERLEKAADIFVNRGTQGSGYGPSAGTMLAAGAIGAGALAHPVSNKMIGSLGKKDWSKSVHGAGAAIRKPFEEASVTAKQWSGTAEHKKQQAMEKAFKENPALRLKNIELRKNEIRHTYKDLSDKSGIKIDAFIRDKGKGGIHADTKTIQNANKKIQLESGGVMGRIKEYFRGASKDTDKAQKARALTARHAGEAWSSAKDYAKKRIGLLGKAGKNVATAPFRAAKAVATAPLRAMSAVVKSDLGQATSGVLGKLKGIAGKLFKRGSYGYESQIVFRKGFEDYFEKLSKDITVKSKYKSYLPGDEDEMLRSIKKQLGSGAGLTAKQQETAEKKRVQTQENEETKRIKLVEKYHSKEEKRKRKTRKDFMKDLGRDKSEAVALTLNEKALAKTRASNKRNKAIHDKKTALENSKSKALKQRAILKKHRKTKLKDISPYRDAAVQTGRDAVSLGKHLASKVYGAGKSIYRAATGSPAKLTDKAKSDIKNRLKKAPKARVDTTPKPAPKPAPKPTARTIQVAKSTVRSSNRSDKTPSKSTPSASPKPWSKGVDKYYKGQVGAKVAPLEGSKGVGTYKAPKANTPTAPKAKSAPVVEKKASVRNTLRNRYK